MKISLSSLALFVVVLCLGQTNKFEAGDFGIRYSLSFNGTAVQGLTFSGMATANIEVGCGVNVQYSKSSSSTNNTTSTYSIPAGGYIPVQQTLQSFSKTINTSLSPFVFYHFKINNNLDIYCGPTLIAGTGPHTFESSSNSVSQGPDYYSRDYTKERYPWGYQLGGAASIGGQYFFYKRLALGVQANLGLAYSYVNGYETSIYALNNSGSNNNSNAANINSSASLPYTGRSFSLTTASSIGINLTFYLAQKAKTAKKAKAP